MESLSSIQEESTNLVQSITIYVSAGDYNNNPFYTFYTDSAGLNELENNTLVLENTYTFRRLNNATGHRFYISDSGVSASSSSTVCSDRYQSQS